MREKGRFCNINRGLWKMKIQGYDQAFSIAGRAAAAKDILRTVTRQSRWDKAHMRTASTRLKKEEYEILRRLCRECKITPYALMGYMLRTWIACMEYEKREGKAWE